MLNTKATLKDVSERVSFLQNTAVQKLQHLIQEGLGAVALGRGEKDFGRRVLDQFSFIQEADAIGNLPGKAHFMGDQYQRHAGLRQL